ncbi:MAG: YdcF family protein [bacterium]|nr:YdcF family protein [bacterium]
MKAMLLHIKEAWNKRKKRVFKVIVIFSLVINISLAVILFTPLIEWMYRPLLIDEQPQKSDVIVILTWLDAYDTKEGFPDFATLARLHKGLELYRQGYAGKIICVGGNKLKTSGKSLARLMKETLMLYGIPEGDIYVQDSIPGHWDYYHNLMQIVERFKGQFDFNRSIVVTSPRNTYRIKKCFLKKGIDPIMVASAKYALHPSNWHIRFELWRDIANEYWAVCLFYALGRI